ncbi:MAG: CDP-glycerol glycerophosphotransferase family protein [Butyrivibrio sp.]|nr:CDP-glycerol glycerophosphotransferase family protein [Butyrivibrio sp.]
MIGHRTIKKIQKGFKEKKRNIDNFFIRKFSFPIVYHIHALAPIKKDKVIFVEPKGQVVTENYELLIDKLNKDYNLDVKVHFLMEKSGVGWEEHTRRRFEFLKDAATASFLIYSFPNDLYGSFKPRKGTKVMNTWHGCGAFKKFGFSTVDKGFGRSSFQQHLYHVHPDYDLVPVSSKEIEWVYIEAMGQNKNPSCVKGIGVSRTDVFYQQDFIDKSKSHLNQLLNEKNRNKKVLLYAPTFRGGIAHSKTPNELNISELYNALKDDYIILLKYHPLVKKRYRPEIPSECSNFALDMTDDMTISELLCAADICITDYSSLIFEYSLLDRPLLFFAYDLDEYDTERGFYYNYKDMVPGPICKTTAELIDNINKLPESFDVEKNNAFKKKFMSGCDGHATERIISEFFGDAIEPFRK